MMFTRPRVPHDWLPPGSEQAALQMAEQTGREPNVRVYLRVREFPDSPSCIAAQDDRTVVLDRYGDFTFDGVSTSHTSQEELFETIGKPITDSCLAGYNGTIFAYGQTGSGKTYTVQGELVNGKPTHDARGLIPRVIEYLFDSIGQQTSNASNLEYLVKCSYLEIYNEQITDLLNPLSDKKLNLREDANKGVYVDGLKEKAIKTPTEALECLEQGAYLRQVGVTAMNHQSSRSHTVFTLEIQSIETNEGLKKSKYSRLHLIDLAGSERQKSTKAVGKQLREASSINSSLSALGNVIRALVSPTKGQDKFVRYRDTKLTMLLRDSLGGNSKTAIIATVSSLAMCYGETLSTLKFAQQAKLIKNKAQVNEDTSSPVTLLQQEVKRLRAQLQLSHKGIPGVSTDILTSPQQETAEEMQDREELESLLQQLLKRLEYVDDDKKLLSKKLEALFEYCENQDQVFQSKNPQLDQIKQNTGILRREILHHVDNQELEQLKKLFSDLTQRYQKLMKDNGFTLARRQSIVPEGEALALLQNRLDAIIEENDQLKSEIRTQKEFALSSSGMSLFNIPDANLLARVRELENQIAQTNAERLQEAEELDSLRKRVREAEEQTQLLKEENESFAKESEYLKHQLQTSQEQYSELAHSKGSHAQESEFKVLSMETALRDAKRQYEKLREHVEHNDDVTKAEIETLSNNVAGILSQHTSVQSELNTVREEKSKLEAEVNDLTQYKSQLLQEYASISNLNQIQNSTLEETIRVKDDLLLETQETKAENDQLKTALQNAQSQKEDLSKTLQLTIALQSEVEKKLEEMTSNYDALNEKYNTSVESKLQEDETKNLETSDLAQALEILTEKYESLTKEYEQLSQAKEQGEATQAAEQLELTQSLAALQESHQTLKNELEAFAALQESHQTLNNELEAFHTLKEEHQTLKEKLDALSTIEEEHLTLKEEHQTLKNELLEYNALKEDHFNLKTEIQAFNNLQEEHQTLKEDSQAFIALQEEHQTLKNELEALISLKEEHQTQLEAFEALQEAHQTLTNQIETLSAHYETEKTQFHTEKETLEEKIAQLEALSNENHNESQIYLQEKEALEERIAELLESQQESAELEEVKQFAEQLRESLQEAYQLQQTNQERMNVLTHSYDEIHNNLRMENERLTETIAKAEEQKAEAKEKIATVLQELAQAVQERDLLIESQEKHLAQIQELEKKTESVSKHKILQAGAIKLENNRLQEEVASLRAIIKKQDQTLQPVNSQESVGSAEKAQPAPPAKVRVLRKNKKENLASLGTA